MSITAKLVGTPQSNATLLLNGNELTSGGTLAASATIPSALFKQLLSFASMNQEVRVVIDTETESGSVKKYDYINEIFTDVNGNTGVKLEKTGMVLYEDGSSLPTGGVDQSLRSNKEFVNYNGAYRLCGYFDPEDSKYKITYGVNSPVNTIIFLGANTDSVGKKQQLLLGAGYANSNIGNNRYFKLGYCYSNASKGDEYSYATDGILTVDNAPHVGRDSDSSKRFGLPFAVAATRRDIGNDGYTGEIFDFRPFVEVYEEDGTLVSRTMGEQFHGEYNASMELTSSAFYCEYDLVPDADAMPNRDDIIRMYLSTYGRRNGAFNYLDYLHAGQRTFLSAYNYADYGADNLACESVDPSELVHETYGVVALGLTLKTVSGNRVDADFFLDPDILSRLSQE